MTEMILYYATPCHGYIRTTVFVVCLGFAGAVHAAGPWHAAEQNTTGWSFMTPDERVEHQRVMRGFRTYEECRAYQEAHHTRMAARAKQAGQILVPNATSGCEQLRARGGIK